MDLSCEEVWREISNYVDEDVDPDLRTAMEEHFAKCKHCTAVLDGTRNVIHIYADERTFSLPAGFSERLFAKLAPYLERPRGTHE
jgi:anti-sigma factor RsiW